MMAPCCTTYGVRESARMVRSGTPESVCMTISVTPPPRYSRRYDIVSDQDLKDARDRRAHFGHNQAARVVSLNRQVAN
jgi:hypothetical protein